MKCYSEFLSDIASTKDYPARLITSHIGAPQENVASHINQILKPYIENNPYVCMNSFQFVEKISTLKLHPHDKLYSFDATALFPSVPIFEATNHILDLLEQDSTLNQRTSLEPQDIVDLISLCLSSSDFSYNGRHHTTNNSGPIGLSLMVTVSQLWMCYTMREAIKTAKNRMITIPKNIFIYMDDIFCTITDNPARPGLRSSSSSSSNTRPDPAALFNECLNSVHERVQFTREMEEDRSIAFLDVYITRLEDGSLSTRVYRKPSNTNIGLKAHSCQDPQTAVASFKGEICRASRLCSSPTQVIQEVKFALDLFEDNGHDRKKFEGIANSYKPSNQKKNNQAKNKKDKSKCTNEEVLTKQLFGELPFSNEPTEADENRKTFACINYIPEIAPQLKRALTKAGVATTFTAPPKLKDILCAKNKTKPDRVRKKGVYKYTCTCSDKAVYIGQTGRSYNVRWEEHKKAIQNEQWQHSGISQHYQNCTHAFSRDNFDIVTNMQDKHKNRLTYNMRIREAMEIRRHGSGPGKGLNEDTGAYVKTDIWDPVLNTIGK